MESITQSDNLVETNNEEDLNKLDNIYAKETNVEKACVQRWFDPIRVGSLRGSTFAMASLVFGSSCLSFPYAILQCGPIVGFLIYLTTGTISLYTVFILMFAGVRTNILDYNGLVAAILGKHWLLVTDVSNLIANLGGLMSYQVTVYKFALDLLNFFFGIQKDDSMNKILVMAVCMVCIQIPLSLLRNISKLQYASIAGTIALIYSIIVIITEMPFYLKNYLQWNSITLFTPLSVTYVDAFTTFLFGFCSHNGIFQVMIELNRPSDKRFKNILYRSFAIEFILYLFISFCGYFSTFETTPDVILERPDLPGFTDYFVKIAKMALFICLHCTMAINYNLMRMSFKSMCFDNKLPPFSVDCVITISVYLLTNTGVYFVANLIQIFGITGGFCTVLICYYNPIMIYVKTNEYRWYHYKNILPLILLVIVSIIGCTSTIRSIISFFRQSH